jgi:hypothetical protein
MNRVIIAVQTDEQVVSAMRMRAANVFLGVSLFIGA